LRQGIVGVKGAIARSLGKNLANGLSCQDFSNVAALMGGRVIPSLYL
jgi:hypothetical protein